MLVRLTALVASYAPRVSDVRNLLGTPGEAGLEPEDLREVLAAVAPIVGATRAASSAGRVARALELQLETPRIEELWEPGRCGYGDRVWTYLDRPRARRPDTA
jgi:hypothetical protein